MVEAAFLSASVSEHVTRVSSPGGLDACGFAAAGTRRSALSTVDALVITPIGPLARDRSRRGRPRRNGKDTPLGHRYRGDWFGRPASSRLEDDGASPRPGRRAGKDGRVCRLLPNANPIRRWPSRWTANPRSRRRTLLEPSGHWGGPQNGRLSVRLSLIPKANLDPLLTISLRSGFGRGGWRSRTVRTKGLICRSTGTELAASRLAPAALAGRRRLRGSGDCRRGDALRTPGADLGSLNRQVAAARAAAAEADTLRQESIACRAMPASSKASATRPDGR